MAILLYCLSIAFAVEVSEIPNPRNNGLWVVDMVDAIQSKEEVRINSYIEQLHRDSDVEIAVVTVANVSETPKEFATDLFNHWGIGGKEKDSGLLVLLVMGQRRLEMETGYGLEAMLPDSWLGMMQADKMVPHFKQGSFGKGIEAGVIAVDVQIREALNLSPAQISEEITSGVIQRVEQGIPSTPIQPEKDTSVSEEETSTIDLLIGFFWLSTMLGGVIAAAVWFYRRQRQCPTCKIQMVMLSEEADDEFLEAGQVMEEKLKSVNYHVYQCGQCGFRKTFTRNIWGSQYKRCSSCNYKTSNPIPETEVIPHLNTGQRKEQEIGSVEYLIHKCQQCGFLEPLESKDKWGSGYSRCSSCSYKTVSSTSETLVTATYTHGGEIRITERCHHCSYYNSRIEHTPMLVETTQDDNSSWDSSSSDSSYSDSSWDNDDWGGGSSGGGGAGSSW